jgi:hypothetical protein
VTAQNEKRREFDLHRVPYRGFERVGVVRDLTELVNVPAVGAEASDDVVARGQFGRAVDGDVVVVVHGDEPAQLEVSGERTGFMADAFLHATVAGDHEHVMIGHVGTETTAQSALGNRHADGIAEALTERPRRHFDAAGVAVFGMSRRGRPELTEALEVGQLESVPAQVQVRVEEDRRVAGGEDETVTVGPRRIGRVVVHDPTEQHVGERRQRHRRSRMARVGFAGRVHGEATDDFHGLRLDVVEGHDSTIPARATRPRS